MNEQVTDPILESNQANLERINLALSQGATLALDNSLMKTWLPQILHISYHLYHPNSETFFGI